MAENSNTYGYIGASPTQLKNNTGVFSVGDVNTLVTEKKFGGSVELIAEESYSVAKGSIDFTSIQEDKYDVHMLQLHNIDFDTGNYNQPAIRLFESGVLESSGVYRLSRQDLFYNNTEQTTSSTTDTSMRLMVDLGTSTAETRSLYVYLYNLGNANKHSVCSFHGVAINGTTQMRVSYGSAMLPQASTVDGIRIFPTSGGNFTKYDIKVYGIKK